VKTEVQVQSISQSINQKNI